MPSRLGPVLTLSAVFGVCTTATLASADESANATPAPTPANTFDRGRSDQAAAARADAALREPRPRLPGPRASRKETARPAAPNLPLLTAGSALLASGYVPALLGAALSDRPQDDKLYIPVAGPWLTMKQGPDEEKPGNKALLATDGAVQGIGALAMLSSLFVPGHTMRDFTLFGHGERFQIAPQKVRSGFGLGARSRF